jgi:hypothetical protein
VPFQTKHSGNCCVEFHAFLRPASLDLRFPRRWLWDMTPSSLAEVYHRFRGMHRLYLHDRSASQASAELFAFCLYCLPFHPEDRGSIFLQIFGSTRLHGVTSVEDSILLPFYVKEIFHNESAPPKESTENCIRVFSFRERLRQRIHWRIYQILGEHSSFCIQLIFTYNIFGKAIYGPITNHNVR